MMAMIFDSDLWTGLGPNRGPNPYWCMWTARRHFAIAFGWDFQRDAFGLKIAIGAVQNSAEGALRYRHARFFNFFNRQPKPRMKYWDREL